MPRWLRISTATSDELLIKFDTSQAFKKIAMSIVIEDKSWHWTKFKTLPGDITKLNYVCVFSVLCRNFPIERKWVTRTFMWRISWMPCALKTSRTNAMPMFGCNEHILKLLHYNLKSQEIRHLGWEKRLSGILLVTNFEQHFVIFRFIQNLHQTKQQDQTFIKFGLTYKILLLFLNKSLFIGHLFCQLSCESLTLARQFARLLGFLEVMKEQISSDYNPTKLQQPRKQNLTCF